MPFGRIWWRIYSCTGILFEYTSSFWCRATEDGHLQVNGRCSRQLEHSAGRVILIRKTEAAKRKGLWYMETLRIGFLNCYNSCSLRIWSQVWYSGACWSQKVRGNGILLTQIWYLWSATVIICVGGWCSDHLGVFRQMCCPMNCQHTFLSSPDMSGATCP